MVKFWVETCQGFMLVSGTCIRLAHMLFVVLYGSGGVVIYVLEACLCAAQSALPTTLLIAAALGRTAMDQQNSFCLAPLIHMCAYMCTYVFFRS
jgi:hypothetical protein